MPQVTLNSCRSGAKELIEREPGCFRLICVVLGYGHHAGGAVIIKLPRPLFCRHAVLQPALWGRRVIDILDDGQDRRWKVIRIFHCKSRAAATAPPARDSSAFSSLQTQTLSLPCANAISVCAVVFSLASSSSEVKNNNPTAVSSLWCVVSTRGYRGRHKDIYSFLRFWW